MRRMTSYQEDDGSARDTAAIANLLGHEDWPDHQRVDMTKAVREALF